MASMTLSGDARELAGVYMLVSLLWRSLTQFGLQCNRMRARILLHSPGCSSSIALC
jgi:hypothetical protein